MNAKPLNEPSARHSFKRELMNEREKEGVKERERKNAIGNQECVFIIFCSYCYTLCVFALRRHEEEKR